jgi:hypothetical protein
VGARSRTERLDCIEVMLAERLWPCLIDDRRGGRILSSTTSEDVVSEAMYNVRLTTALLELAAATLRFRLNSAGFRGTSSSLLPISSSRRGARRFLDVKPRRPALRRTVGTEAGGLTGNCTLPLEADEAGNRKSGAISSRENELALPGCCAKSLEVEDGTCWG